MKEKPFKIGDKVRFLPHRENEVVRERERNKEWIIYKKSSKGWWFIKRVDGVESSFGESQHFNKDYIFKVEKKKKYVVKWRLK
jgi:hypothetical protein